MDQDIKGQPSRELVLLDAIRQWVAEPMERQIASLESQMRDQAMQTREALTRMSDDFRAAIATMSNPDTGYVPRSEIKLLFAAVDERITTFITGVEQRERDRKINTRWAIGTAIAVATVLATLVSAIITFFHSTPTHV